MTKVYEFEYKNMEFSKDGQLDELIVLDRYAIPAYDGYTVGDTVVFIADELMETKRVGVIEEIYNDDTYKVRDRFGEEHTVRKELMHKPLELKPAQLWERWAKGAASVEKTKELKKHWENEFRWLFDGYRYSLGGRIQLMLGQEFVTGKKANLTAYNCFSGDTIVQTKQGAKFIKDLKGEVEVLSKDGIYRKAYFKDYGVQELFEIELENGETLKATAGHEWIVTSKGGKYTKVTTLELEGKRIPVIGNKRNFDKKSKEVLEGIRHGIYYGDGTVNKNHNNKPSGHLLLFGEKRELVKYFEGYHIVEHHEGKYLGVYGINPNLKQVPTDDKSDEYWYGFIIGLIATDGYVDNRGSVMLHSSNINDLKTIIKNLYKTGFVYSSLKMSREINPYNGEKSPNYKLQFVKQTVKEDDLLRSSHKNNFINSPHTNKAYTIKVVKVRPLNISETVYCCEEPETHSFVVGTGYLTGNCYVVKSPEGKETPVEQFLEVLDIAYKEASIMRRGGGVGLNISYINTVKGSGRTKKFFKLLLPETHKDYQELLDKQKLGKFDAVEVITKLDKTIKPEQYIEVEDSVEGLFEGVNEMVIKAYDPTIDELVIDFSNIRHRNAIVKGVNGRSSGAVSWMELYVLIAKLLQQETIDNVEFAEIYSFIVHLIIQGGTRRGALMLVCNVDNANIRKFITRKRTFGYLSGANISVAIDDTFMDKVKKAKELIKTQNVMSTDLQEAHDLWMLIIESAWSSAEPGVIFMERYNKESNSWYFSKVIATNPCLHKDSYLVTENGLEKISQLKSKIHNTERYVESRAWKTGVKKVIKLTTKSGFEYIVTPDHKFLLKDETWEEAGNLLGKDIKFDVSEKEWRGYDPYNNEVNYKILGFILGDGMWYTASNRMTHIIATPEKDDEVINMIENEFNDKFDWINGKYQIKIPYGTPYANTFTGKIENRTIPDWILQLPKKQMADFLCGLFSANGNNLKKYNKIQLVSVNKKMLQQVQQMLLLFGIKAKLWCHNKENEVAFKNDTYTCKENYHLVISRKSYEKYLDKIGFIQTYKNGYNQVNRKEELDYETVVSIHEMGEEEVWDFHESNLHRGICNGAIVHNCGEQGLPAWGVCNLGHMVLPRFYDKEKNDVKWDELARAVRIAVRLQDNIIDYTPYFLKENEEVQMKERRVGIGSMGLGTLMIKLGLRYGSDEGNKFVDKLYKFIAYNAYDASIELAKEKGAFPAFEYEKHIQSGFMKRLLGEFPELKEKLKKYGIRNVTLLTQAPTGSTGTYIDNIPQFRKEFGGTTTGIEPYFSWEYWRAGRLGVTKQTVDLAKEYMEKHGLKSLDELPDYFVTAMELSPADHVKVQAAVQKWTDSSISKTANCPNDYTIEQTDELYMLAYELGLKGMTI